MQKEESFISLWRNSFIRLNINRFRFENQIIKIRFLSLLERDAQYLARLPKHVPIQFEINDQRKLQEYLKSKYSHAINRVILHDSLITPFITQVYNQSNENSDQQIQSFYGLEINGVTGYNYAEIIVPHSIQFLRCKSFLVKPKNQGFFNSIKTIEYEDISVLSISSENFPQHVENVFFKVSTLLIPPNLFPDSTKSIVFVGKSNPRQTLTLNVLPPKLHRLELGSSFNTIIPPNVLPETLKVLNLGNAFNKPIGLNVLPKGLEKLVLGFQFREKISKGELPLSLKSLVLGSFNHELLPGVLPKWLEYIRFGDSFDQLVAFPPNIKTIIFTNKESKRVYPIPTSVTFYKNYNMFFDGSVPKGLKIPKEKNLKELHLYHTFLNQSLPLDFFPSNLMSLTFSYENTLKQGDLPPNLSYLKLSTYQPIDIGVLPDSLVRLNLHIYSKTPLQSGSLPPNLTELKISSERIPIPENLIPEKVRILKISCLSEIQQNTLPSNLLSLYISSKYLQNPFPFDFLPKSLKDLRFSLENELVIIDQLFKPDDEGFGIFIPSILPQSLDFISFGQKKIQKRVYIRKGDDLKVDNY
ncbi:hypothetical protein CYY_009694 [Polysphondylium violaceum]|uniref:FNIP repeat-containing protein n=1 Tax=Polysphondylium violaceum TaxID=133409 RepID=A0A8J4PLW3_9MYCE|nr:hypothetical protein CYY_009694 [Polysphondylium violaceum]